MTRIELAGSARSVFEPVWHEYVRGECDEATLRQAFDAALALMKGDIPTPCPKPAL